MARRLLLVLAVPMRGGAEDYALTIGAAAVRRGWSVQAAVPFAPGTESLRRDLQTAGIACSPLLPVNGLARDEPRPSKGAKLRAAAGLVRVVRRFRPDVVQVTLPWPTYGFPFMLCSTLLGLPTLVTFQLVPTGLAVGRVRRLVYKWMRGRRQRWIAVSDHARHLVAAMYRMDPATVGVIRNGAAAEPADSEGNARRSNQRIAIRAELGLPADATVLLSVGRLHHQKGQVDLVCATAGVYANRPDIRLLIAGDGPERERLDELVDALALQDVVRLLGHRQDAALLMDAADLFVFPSHFEGTPFALLEAMAHGLPVVAAAFGGADEILEHGRTGRLVPVGRPGALRSAIVEALADPRGLERMAAAGRERAAHFSQDAMVAATMRELDELCGL